MYYFNVSTVFSFSIFGMNDVPTLSVSYNRGHLKIEYIHYVGMC